MQIIQGAVETARGVIAERYPECYLALLAGSVVRGEATPTSDLDVVVLTRAAGAPYRESLLAAEWPVEVFVHSEASLKVFFTRDAERRRPSLQTMCAEGVVLKDTENRAASLKAEARRQLSAGPPPLRPGEVLERRYFLTDDLDDFIGATTQIEAFFALSELLPGACDFIFDTRREWRGGGKWTPRRLEKVDPERYERLVEALTAFTERGDRKPIVIWLDAVLAPFGGRLFAGFSLGKPDSPASADEAYEA